MTYKKILKWSAVVIMGFFILIQVCIDVLLIKMNPIGLFVNQGVCRADTCAECHPQQYKEWRAGQVAAFAAIREIMEAEQAAEFAGPFCWKCHDPFKQGLDEGVTCEFCHGKTGESGCDQSDMDVHIAMRKKSLMGLRDETWCFQCHSFKQPFTGADLQGTVQEWSQSKARQEGVTCQNCHMPLVGEGDTEHHFHGHYYPGRNPMRDRKSISIEAITVDDGNINVFVKNYLTSHYLPSGASTKALFLKVSCYGDNNELLFEYDYLFLKRFKFKKFMGLKEVPHIVYKDTRIKPEEERKIAFSMNMKNRTKKIVASLRFGFIGDFGEEIEAWTSDYIAEKEVVF